MNYRDYSKQLVDIIKGQVHLENFEISKLETAEILEGKQKYNWTNEKYIIADNLKEAWKFVFELNDYPLSIMFLTELNKIIGHNLMSRNGRFRNKDVLISGSVYKPKMVSEYEIREKLEPLIENKDYIKLVLEMMKTQIFDDGNKRTAIMVLQKTLLEQGKILSLNDSNIKELIKSILTYYEQSDPTPFSNFVSKNTVKLIKNKDLDDENQINM